MRTIIGAMLLSAVTIWAENTPMVTDTVFLPSGGSVSVGLLRLIDHGTCFEDIAQAPGAEDSFPGGSGVTIDLEINHDFGMAARLGLSLLSPPYDSRDTLLWFGNRIGLVDAKQGPGVDGVYLRVDREAADGLELLGRFHIPQGDAVQVGPGLRVKFLSHGHKITGEGGPPSPLIIRMEYKENLRWIKEDAAAATYGNTGFWAWKSYRFFLADYEYGDWMDLIVARYP